MTRINLVKVEDLADQHLFAEWREIKMIPAKVRKLWLNMASEIDGHDKFQALHLSNLPPKYLMSTGHVRFFYDKFYFLVDRYFQLTRELKERKYDIAEHNIPDLFFKNIPYTTRLKDWHPSIDEVMISIGRIEEKLKQRPDWYRYYGEVKPPEFFIERYRQQAIFDGLAGSKST